MANTKQSSARGSFNSDTVSKIKEQIKTHISSYFQATLGTETDIVNIVAGLIYLESRYNSNATGPLVSSGDRTAGGDYVKSSAVQKVLNGVDAAAKGNVNQGLVGIGLMQVMGWNFVKKGSLRGMGEIERLRPEFISLLCVDAGADIFGSILGDGNISKSILAGLVILEGKWKAVNYANGNYFFTSDKNKNVFNSRIAAAVGAYLGLGTADRNGTTPVAYSNSIVGGASYIAANGTNPIIYKSSVRTASAIAAGPSTNGVNRSKISIPGCA